MSVFRKVLAVVRQDEPVHTASEGVSLTAHSGGGQANATLLANGVNNVSTVAVAADSVKLPPAVGGTVIVAANNGANSMQVFGDATAGDTINGVATGTGVAVANGKNAIFVCYQTANSSVSIPGKWVMILSA